MYVDDQIEDCYGNPCAVSWTNQSSLSFVGNNAFRGPLMYGGMLDRCSGSTKITRDKIQVNGTDSLYYIYVYIYISWPDYLLLCVV